jgi:hypothetical protein
VAINAPFVFRQVGPTSIGSTITALSTSSFQLGPIGVYKVDFQASITEAAQVSLWVDSGSVNFGGVIGPGPLEIAPTTVGRSTGTSQAVLSTLIQTVGVNTAISVRNGSGSASALTLTVLAGGSAAATSTLVITQLA